MSDEPTLADPMSDHAAFLRQLADYMEELASLAPPMVSCGSKVTPSGA